MKKILSIILPILLIVVFTQMQFPQKDISKEIQNSDLKSASYSEENKLSESSKESEEENESEYIKDDGIYSQLTYEQKKSISDKIDLMPGDNAPGDWVSLGPNGLWRDIQQNIKFSGRIFSSKVIGNKIYLNAETGGIWKLTTISNITYRECISENVRARNFYSFDINPFDENNIIMSTDMGFFRTLNGGTNWTQVYLNPPNFATNIVYDPTIQNKIHFTGNFGYTNSLNNGQSVNNSFSLGNLYFMGLHVNPISSQIICVSIWRNDNQPGAASLYSTNGGSSFNTPTGLPASGTYNAVLTHAYGTLGTVYMLAENSTSNRASLYKSTNNGQSWSFLNSNVKIELSAGQWLFLSASSSNPNTILFGGARMYRSTTGGISWDTVGHAALHPDIHGITWDDANNRVLATGDGGLQVSTDNGVTWNTNLNALPITQYYHFDISKLNPNYIIGGSQDNGLSYTTSFGALWTLSGWGDGDAPLYDAGDANIAYGIIGAGFYHVKSVSAGAGWFPSNSGVPDTPNQFGGEIVSDGYTPTWLYSSFGNYIYKSTNQAASWTKVNNTPFFANNGFNYFHSISIQGGSEKLYICRKTNQTGQRVFRINIGSNDTAMTNMETGLPIDYEIKKIVPSRMAFSTSLYALVYSTNSFVNNSIYKSTNNGSSWRNISGNLPNALPNDLIEFPQDTSRLIVGTEYGCFKTTNGGINWQRWNRGMPEGVKISQVKSIDSTLINGRFHIVIGTYGRGIYYRNFNEPGDPIISISSNSSLVDSYSLQQNYPNPFNPVTSISFSIPKKQFVNLKIYNSAGKEVAQIVNQNLNPGKHNYRFDASGLSSGVYFYSLQTENFTDTKKMMLIK